MTAQPVAPAPPPRPRMTPEVYVGKVAKHIIGGPRVSARLARRVLAAIAAKADWDAWSWGEHSYRSAQTIGAEIGYSERAVRYAYGALVEAGWLMIEERPGRTNIFTVLAPVEVPPEPERPVWTKGGRRVRNHLRPVDNPVENRPAPAPSAHAHVAGGAATVAADLGNPPTDPPPEAPDRARKGNADGADAPAQAAPGAPPGNDPSSTSSPPSPAGVVAEPHRRMRGAGTPAGPRPPSPEHPAAALYGPLPADQPVERASRRLTRELRRCPRCGAPPGESCRNRRGRPRTANHAERRPPRL